MGRTGRAAPEAILRRVRGRLDARFVDQAPRGPAAARNEGVALASGELIAFVDDDCRPAPDWLRRVVERWRLDPEAAIGGHTVNALADNRWARTSQLIIDHAYRQNGHPPNAGGFFTTNNLLLSRAQFLELGGFDEAFRTAEDRDLADRWIERGWPMVYLPDAIVSHAHVMDVREFVRQHFRYGRGAYALWRKRAVSGRPAPRVDPDLVLGVTRASFGRRLGAALVLWHLANAAGYAYQATGARLGGRRGAR